MIVHTVGTLGSFVALLVAAAALPRVIRHNGAWRKFLWPFVALAIASVVTGFYAPGNAPWPWSANRVRLLFSVVTLIGHAPYRYPGQTEPTG